MRLRTCSTLLLLLVACVTAEPRPRAQETPSPRIARLQRAAALPWRDEGRCIVQEAAHPWPVMVERCFQALDTHRVRFRDVEHRCPVASADAASVETLVGICLLTQPELVVGAVVVIGLVVTALAIQEELETYRLSRLRPGEERAQSVPGTKPISPQPLAEPDPHPQESPSGKDWLPPVPPETSGQAWDRRCEPVPVPHRGGDDIHDACADTFPPNRYPGRDVFVGGKRFDALQVGAPVLWEIKTDRFDTYSLFLRDRVVKNQLPDLQEERDIAEACGYGFVVGVSSPGHKAALEAVDRTLDIVVTGCDR